MLPDPPNSLICSVFLTLAAAGSLQCERLEPPVVLASLRVLNNSLGGIVMPIHSSIGKVNYVTNSPIKISMEQYLHNPCYYQMIQVINLIKTDKCLTNG